MKSKKEPTTGVSISLPLAQVNRLYEMADEQNESLSATTSRMIKLGFVYLRALEEQSKNEEAALAAAENRTVDAILRAKAAI